VLKDVEGARKSFSKLERMRSGDLLVRFLGSCWSRIASIPPEGASARRSFCSAGARSSIFGDFDEFECVYERKGLSVDNRRLAV
jgi:hypothetical protein